jgi:hypothetical protein
VDRSPISVNEIPGQLMELTRAQAQRDQHDEQGRQTLVRVIATIEPELIPARAATS